MRSLKYFRVEWDLVTRNILKLGLMLLTSRNWMIRRIFKALWQEPIVLRIGYSGMLTWRFLGEVSTSLGQRDLALKCHRQLLGHNPKSAADYFQVAADLMELGKYEESLPFFLGAITLNPEWFGAYEVYGRCLWVCGQYEKAAVVWSRGLDEQRRQAKLQGLGEVDYRVLDSKWTKWLGNNAHLDAYLKLSILDLSPRKKIKILARKEDIANLAYLGYWNEHVELLSSPEDLQKYASAAIYLGEPLHVFYGYQVPVYYYYAMGLAQAAWEQSGRSPLLSISGTDDARGRECLKALGIPDGAWYVCLHVREAGFWEEETDPTNKPRNAEVSTYLPAIEHIVDAGGWVIRMGDSSMRSLPPMRGVVDYASSALKSDWMDVFLCATCQFFFGTNSALYHVCVSFGVPSALTNWIPIASHPLQGKDLFIPKLLFLIAENRKFTFSEIMSQPRDIWSGHYFARNGIEVIDNTPEEIVGLVHEMMASLGIAVATELPEDAALQSKYKILASSANILANAKIGREFLRKHQHLLS